MRIRGFSSVTEPEISVEPQSVRSISSTSHLGKVRLAIVEIGLCIVVPCTALLMWGLCDRELQMTLLSDSKRDVAIANNRVMDMIPVGDDTVLSMDSQGRMRFWNMSRGAVFGENQSRLTAVTCAAYEPRDRLVAIGSASGKMEIWDLDQPDEPIAESAVDQFDIEACRFTPDGRFLCSAGSLGQILIWEARTLTLIRTLGLVDDAIPIRRLEITRDGRYLLAGDKRGILRIWDLHSDSLIRTVNVAGHSNPTAADYEHTMIEAIMILPGDQEFVAVTRTAGISVWNISTGKCTRRWHSGTVAFHSACLTPDGQRLIAGNAKGELWMWETATGRCLKSMHLHSTIVRAVAFDHKRNVVISGDFRGEICCTPNFVTADI